MKWSPPEEAFDDIPAAKPDKDMIEIARKIIEQKEGAFEPAKFEDRYENALRELIRRKEKGEKLVTAEPVEDDNVIDLMAALKKSLKTGGGKKKARALAAGARPARVSTARMNSQSVAGHRRRPRWPARCGDWCSSPRTDAGVRRGADLRGALSRLRPGGAAAAGAGLAAGLRRKLARRDWLALAWLGLSGNVIYYICLAVAVKLAGPAPASLIMGLLPVVITLIGSARSRRCAAEAVAAVAGAGRHRRGADFLSVAGAGAGKLAAPGHRPCWRPAARWAAGRSMPCSTPRAWRGCRMCRRRTGRCCWAW